MTPHESRVRAPGICASCHAPLAPTDRYCRRCGQAARPHAPTLREFVHEFVSHYVALDGGVLWRSLGALLLQPGRLAREYFAGRRTRYVSPLRLYLTASILFFVAIGLLGGVGDTAPVTDVPSRPVIEVEGSLQPEIDALTQPWPLADAARVWLRARLAAAQVRLQAETRGEFIAGAARRFVSSLYYAMFLLLPVFAALCKLVYLNRRRTYGEHVVHALYLHAFAFFTLLLLFVVPAGVVVAAAVLWLLAYPYFDLRRVFGGRRTVTLLRLAALTLLYLLAALPVVLVFFAAAMLGSPT